MADISGIARDGRKIEIECKTGSGRLNDAQKRWRDNMRRWNGIWILARDADEAADELLDILDTGL